MYRPLHRKPKNRKKVLATAAAVGAVGGAATITGIAPASASGGTVWDRLAACESGGNFSNMDTGGNGHYGGFQFSPATWASVGGVGNPANASPSEQLLRAKILLAEAGPGQWACAPTAGLTRANGAAEGLSILGASVPQVVTQTPPVVGNVHHHRHHHHHHGTFGNTGDSNSNGSYTVVSGDTLSDIAAAHGVQNWQTVYDANRSVIGANPDLIQVGETLTIP